MSVRYYGLGGQRRLHEVIFAGSHDAAITEGGSSAKTQEYDIHKQADEGVRLFDMRIIAKKTARGGELVGYHGKKVWTTKTKMTNTYSSSNNNELPEVKLNKIMGTTGLSLAKMLKDAKTFVSSTAKNEFLIFKFAKCKNWDVIAQACVDILGINIYKPKGETSNLVFGKLTLDDLKGKVVCVFDESELANIKTKTTLEQKDGILGFRQIQNPKQGWLGTSFGGKKGKPYKPDMLGLQYFGKGGTRWWNGRSDQTKIQQNIKKQSKLMLTAATHLETSISPNVLGMMYWTTTGAFASIENRNNVMWNETGVNRMKDLWAGGLEAAVGHQLEQERIKVLKWKGVSRMKAFFPNIIMVDFADTRKCSTIYELNKLKDDKLEAAYNKYVGAA